MDRGGVGVCIARFVESVRTTGCSVPATRLVRDQEIMGPTPISPTLRRAQGKPVAFLFNSFYTYPMLKHAQESKEEVIAKKILRKIDRLMHTLDRLEDKIDDVHDHLMVIMDEIFDTPEERAAAESASIKKQEQQEKKEGKIYNA